MNIAAIFAGAWYYWVQLKETPLPLAVFVPDCPLYVLLALPILLKRIKNGVYSYLVSCGMVLYGAWTVFVLLFYWSYYSQPAFLPVTLVFILGHIGMVWEGLALLPKKRVPFAALAFALAWFLLNDVSDYVWGTIPPIPPVNIDVVAALTVAASIAIPLLFFLRPEKIRSAGLVKFGRWIIGN
ncbi:Uncharacterised protein [uncultured archaeon]|nr:Uncharacterised protein [uncultured archaeon]